MSREIDDLDFNGLRSKIIEIIGPGSGTYGYGQSIKSSPVFQGNIITKSQWDGLRYDLINVLVHQSDVTPNVIEVVRGDVVGEADPLLEYNELIEAAKESRFNLAPSQSIITSVATKTYTSPWNISANATITLSFTTSDEARFFFNSGGKIRLSSNRTGGSATAQNGAWSYVLTNSGVIEFGANSQTLTYYQLTNSYQTLFERGLSTPYSSNIYKIRVLSNVANNASGTATTITFDISWTDNYSETFPNNVVDPADRVDGTLSLSIEEVKASGSLQPSGSFSIASPSYSISDISASYDPSVSIPPPVVYNEIVSVPSSVLQNQTFSGSITGGAPNTAFSVEWRNSSGTITAAGSALLDGSGNYSSGAIGVFPIAGTYTLRTSFAFTGNVVNKTTVVIPVSAPPPPPPAPPCVNPPDTQDSLAIYQTGMVIVYSGGFVQRNNTLVKSTKTSNARVVNSWYNAIIRRPADPEGLNYWVSRIESGENPVAVLTAFAAAANAGEIAAYGKVSAVYTFCGYNG